ncbi:MAG: hypothetical protein IT385_21075 [Deltaproteobacteria bacterium]|nr:hypothetical protein [Deltaproteobacteria bacterium]
MSVPEPAPSPAYIKDEPRRWPLLLGALVVLLGVRLGWGEPRLLGAAEADTLEAGVGLVDALTDETSEAGLVARLRTGFETRESHPRLDDFPPDQGYRRAVLEAPVPRWLAAAGIGLWPGSDDTANGVRAGWAAALALALAVLLLAGARPRAPAANPPRALDPWLAPALLLTLPGVLDAGVSAGYGAAAILVMAALARTIDRWLATGRGAIVAGALVGLAFGIHPMAIALVVVVFVTWAIARAPTGPEDPTEATVRLPAAPPGLFLVPLVAFAVLIAVWPALWGETGKRIGAWLLDYGFYFNPPVEVAGQLYHQHVDRAAPAWTALVQWVAWTPFPVVALWLAGVARALLDGRDGAWFPILAWLALLLCGAMDGSLFGSRWSLLALMWVPTALTAATGLGWAMRAAARVAPRVPRAVVALIALAVPTWQALAVSTWGAASQTGSDLTFALPLGLLDRVAEAEPGGVVAIVEGPGAEYSPQLDAAKNYWDKDVRVGDARQARWGLAVLWSAEAREREHGEAIVVDRRPGVGIMLWRRP